MKRKGFTLIELLAVIVVLAIIALIATPIVMNVIKNAQMGATERSADNYVRAVDLLISTEQLSGTPLVDGEYTIGTAGKITKDGKSYEVQVSGTKPNGGKIVVKDGQVVKDSSTISYGDYTVTYKDGVAEAKELAKLLDVCELAAGTANTVGAKYTCNLGDKDRTFYVLEAGTSSKPATLILEGHYDTTTHKWCASGNDNTCAAEGLPAKLDSIAEAWNKLDRTQVALPSAEQIMAADGQELGDAYDYSLSKEWLYSDDNEVGGNTVYGYWTSTPSAAIDICAWAIDSGHMRPINVQIGVRAIRPVITLSI